MNQGNFAKVTFSNAITFRTLISCVLRWQKKYRMLMAQNQKCDKKWLHIHISPLFTKIGIYLFKLWHFLIIFLSKFFPNKVLFLWWHSFSTKTHWSFKCTYIVLQASKRSVLCIWNECMIGHNFTFVACDCAPFWKHYYKINFS